MFKRFNSEQHTANVSSVKNSVQRSIQSKLTELYPALERDIDLVCPKKAMMLGKGDVGEEKVQLIIINNDILFFGEKDGNFYPTLKLLHKYPTMMKRMQVDKGAIKFILGGANIMCRGFTSPGGVIPIEPMAEGEPVAVYCEGKEHAIAIGVLKMSTDAIVSVNSGIAVECLHFLNDGLYVNSKVE